MCFNTHQDIEDSIIDDVKTWHVTKLKLWQKTFLLSFPFMDEIVPLFARRVVIQFSECVEKVFFDHSTAIVYLILFAKNNTVKCSKN